jgi:monoamine oxidase
VNRHAALPADTDAVVVGAGISGLVAALDIVAAGHTVSLIESRDRVGGRAATVRTDDGEALDTGATWFWPGEKRIAVRIAELSIATHPQDLTGDALYHDPSGTKRMTGNPLDVPSGRFSDGAASLATALSDRLPNGVLRTGTSVTGVAASARSVTVRTAVGDIATRHVVIALPPALAAHAIAFSPELDAPLADVMAVTPVWMGAVAKVVVRFAHPFWRHAGLAGAAISHVGPLRELHDMSGVSGRPAALFGFAMLTRNVPGPPSEAAVRSQLRELYGPQMPEPEEILVTDWRADPHTSPPGVDELTNYDLFGHRLYQQPAMGGRLHWASTETSLAYAGHIEGAIRSGERAARNVASALVT